MLGELIPCGGGDSIPLLKSRLLIGRRTSCDISLKFPNVSSHHCEMEFENGYWIVRDLGSRNGIKVNGVRCESKWLMPGDVLSVAKHKFEMNYTPASDGPPPETENPFALSLLEKAGLGGRPAEPVRRPPPPASRSAPASKGPPTEEDRILDWLNEPVPEGDAASIEDSDE